MDLKLGWTLFILGGAIFWAGCQPAKWEKMMPPASELGSPRGYQLIRAVIHLHSPISYDACDSDTSADQCLSDLRSGLCMNRVDIACLTDHPGHMAETDFADLHLYRPGDQRILSGGLPVGNQFTCSDGHTVIVTAGFEGQLLALGLTQHLDPDPTVRVGLYDGNDAALVTKIQTNGGIAAVPHTESRSDTLLDSLGMNAMEAFNLHALVNPKMRKDFLGFDPFEGLLDLLVDLVDPYGDQQTDLAFLRFWKLSPVYGQRWNHQLAQSKHVMGLAGNDSHQNFFKGKASDGDRVDSHRRLIRWVTHYLIVTEKSLVGLKDALLNSRGWMVFEGLGTLKGMDFYGKNSIGFTEMGGTLTYQAGQTFLHVDLPKLHAASPQSDVSPMMILRLKKIDTAAHEEIVMSATDAAIDYLVTSPGVYRVEMSTIPRHLEKFLGYKKENARREIVWALSNPIFVQ